MGWPGRLVVAAIASCAVAWTPRRAPPTARPAARVARRRAVVMMPSNTPQMPYTAPGTDYHQYISVYQRLLQDRIIICSRFLDEDKCNELIGTLLYLKNDNPRLPISIYFNVPGALMKPCLAVYDTMMQLPCPISTVNLGLATGMGAFLCSAGAKGSRVALPNSRFLMQRTGLDDPFRGQATDIGLIVKENLRDNARVEKMLAEFTGHPLTKIHKDMERDFYLSAFEAVQYGLIDRVLIPPPKDVAPVNYYDNGMGIGPIGL